MYAMHVCTYFSWISWEALTPIPTMKWQRWRWRRRQPHRRVHSPSAPSLSGILHSPATPGKADEPAAKSANPSATSPDKYKHNLDPSNNRDHLHPHIWNKRTELTTWQWQWQEWQELNSQNSSTTVNISLSIEYILSLDGKLRIPPHLP